MFTSKFFVKHADGSTPMSDEPYVSQPYELFDAYGYSTRESAMADIRLVLEKQAKEHKKYYKSDYYVSCEKGYVIVEQFGWEA